MPCGSSGESGFSPAVKQGQSDQAGGAGLGLVFDVGPGAVVALLLFQKSDAFADRPLHFLAGHGGRARTAGELAKIAKRSTNGSRKVSGRGA